MRDGEVIYHRVVGFHRPGERWWRLWCEDCDYEATFRDEADQLVEWSWHLCGAVA